MTMAHRIKACRKQAQLTQKELAAKIGVKEAAVSKWENGKVDNIPRSTIKALADLFGVHPCYLMGFSNDPRPTNGGTSIYDRVASELGKEAAEILKLFSGMNDQGQQLALSMLQSLACNPSNTEQKKETLGA